MPPPFGLLIVFRVDSLCFVFPKFVLPVRFVVVLVVFQLYAPLSSGIYIYVTFKGTFNHAEI